MNKLTIRDARNYSQWRWRIQK